MTCSICGRVLRNQQSKELGYGPKCYKKVFGKYATKQSYNKSSSFSVNNFPYYDIPGQMRLDDYMDLT